MANMSFMLTPRQFQDGSKDVTRRMGWKNIKIGAPHVGILKGQGLKRGEKITRLGLFIPIESRWEPLRKMTDDLEYGRQEVIREGFPDLSPHEFVKMFCQTHKGCTPETEVNRIQFVRVYVQ